MLEDEHEHAVRRGDREQVEHDCLHGDHDRAERDEQEREGEHQDEREHERRCGLQLLVPVLRRRGHARHGNLRTVDGTHGPRNDVLTKSRERRIRSVVGSVALDRDRHACDGPVVVDVDRDRLVHPPCRDGLHA